MCVSVGVCMPHPLWSRGVQRFLAEGRPQEGILGLEAPKYLGFYPEVPTSHPLTEMPPLTPSFLPRGLPPAPTCSLPGLQALRGGSGDLREPSPASPRPGVLGCPLPLLAASPEFFHVSSSSPVLSPSLLHGHGSLLAVKIRTLAHHSYLCSETEIS